MINVSANRRAVKWSRRELWGRILWGLVYPLFRFSPRPFFWGWRRMLLQLCGGTIGRDVHVYPSVRITMPWNLEIGDQSAIGDRVTLYALGKITIGPRVTISQGAHLCAGTHDWRNPSMPLQKLPIEVGADAWICADAFIGPDVKVGEEAIVGARGVVTNQVQRRTIVAGNPAREIGKRNT